MNNAEPEEIKARIFKIRGQQVLLDTDLAKLYGVPVFRLNESVKRNMRRFPPDFLFQLTRFEWANLISQIAISKSGHGGRRHSPYAFTEQGIAMLSSVLQSERAIDVNIAIMRAFVKLRHALLAHQSIARRVEKLEGKVGLLETDVRFIHDDVRNLRNPAEKTGPTIKGFEKD